MNEPTSETSTPILPVPPPLSPEDRIRAAKSPEEIGFALIALAGQGVGFTQIIGAIVDAKVEDSHLPQGTSRADVKKGLQTLFGGLGALFAK